MRNHNVLQFTVISFLLIALAMVSGGCSKQQAGGGKFAMPPTPVEVARASTQKVADTFDAVGSIEASRAITVVSEIDGLIVSLPFAEGTTLQKGNLIVQLDDAQLAAEVARTEALASQSKIKYDRVKTVVDQHAGAPQDLDDAAASLKVAEANLALAKAKLAKAHVTAPFAGLIGARKVSVGTFLRAGQPVADLADIDEIRVSFSAPENFLPNLKPGASVNVFANAYPDKPVAGHIIAIEPVLDAGTRSARVVARVANTGRFFRPGMSASVSAVLTERANAITIPNAAIFASGTQSFVYMVKPDSTVARVPVTLGTRLPDVVEITKGLDAGSTVVVAGHQKLFEGAKVMPVASAPASPQTAAKQ